MPVRQLDPAMINRIAAGEVVERPASVVKELVENALDAGARRIQVLTDGGGRRLMRVTDDGDGMTRADLALAFARHASEPNAWAIAVDAGAKSEVKPAALSQGTRVEVQDLFYATPARLKFLKTDRTEAEAIRDVVRRLAMARPDIAFTLAGEERAPVTWPAALPGAAGRLTRLGDILGADFRNHAIDVRAEREGV